MDKDSKALIARIQRYTTQDIDELMEDCVHSIERLNAENARLRKALTKTHHELFMAILYRGYEGGPLSKPSAKLAEHIARAVLAEKEEK